MRKIVAAIMFVLVIISFFYQYKYGASVPEVSSEDSNKSPASEETMASGVTPKPETQSEQTKSEIPDDVFSIHSDDIVLGNRNSSVVLIEYSSLTCPHCAYFHKDVYPELKKKYIDTGKIAYVLREFVSNTQDLDGAILARCLDDKDDPLKLLNVLYAQQDNWAFNKNYREILENIGQLAGISRAKYGECLARTELVQMLANNSRSITFYKGFVGTPAFVINGEMHKGIYDEATIAAALDKALESVAKK